jgi:hypothetical protein
MAGLELFPLTKLTVLSKRVAHFLDPNVAMVKPSILLKFEKYPQIHKKLSKIIQNFLK